MVYIVDYVPSDYSQDILPRGHLKIQPTHTKEELAMAVRYPAGFCSGALDAAMEKVKHSIINPYQSEREPPRPILPDPPGSQRRAQSARPTNVKPTPTHFHRVRQPKVRGQQKSMTHVEQTRMLVEGLDKPATIKEIADMMERTWKALKSDLNFLARGGKLRVLRIKRPSEPRVRIHFFGLTKTIPPLDAGCTLQEDK